MKKIKTNWDLTLLYKNEKDPQIEKDLINIEKLCSAFAKKYKSKDFTTNVKLLMKALEDWENLLENLGNSKPLWYLNLRTSLDSGDSTISALETQFSQRLTKAHNLISFFYILISKITKKNQIILLKSPLLKDYRYSLKRTFLNGNHTLSEAEENIISLFRQTSYGMWTNSLTKALGQATVEYKNEILPLSKAQGVLFDLPQKDRGELYQKIVEVQKAHSSQAEAEINAIVNYKKVIDEKKGYKYPFSSTVLNYENEETTVLNLVKVVTDNFKISHRFYKIHAKLLNEEKISYADRMTKIGSVQRKFNFSDAVEITSRAFEKIDSKYKNILNTYLENGQIDVYPKKGKKGGAFCSGRGQYPTFVLLNQTDGLKSIQTLAHEMGHAIHGDSSKHLPQRYSHYSISTAEVASTFFEQAVTAELENELSESELIIHLHNKILGDINTIFRQIACFNYEYELHNLIREKGEITKEEMAELMKEHLSSYLGNSVNINHDDGYQFVTWHHIRYFFYVYSYAFGKLISRALFENLQKDKSYTKKIEQFLKAGRSMSPEDIFKSIGIDVTNPSFFESGLKSIEKDIEKLEKLAKKTNKI